MYRRKGGGAWALGRLGHYGGEPLRGTTLRRQRSDEGLGLRGRGRGLAPSRHPSLGRAHLGRHLTLLHLCALALT